NVSTSRLCSIAMPVWTPRRAAAACSWSLLKTSSATCCCCSVGAGWVIPSVWRTSRACCSSTVGTTRGSSLMVHLLDKGWLRDRDGEIFACRLPFTVYPVSRAGETAFLWPYRRRAGVLQRRDGDFAVARLARGNMRYSRVHIDAIGYELPPMVVTSTELE